MVSYLSDPVVDSRPRTISCKLFQDCATVLSKSVLDSKKLGHPAVKKPQRTHTTYSMYLWSHGSTIKCSSTCNLINLKLEWRPITGAPGMNLRLLYVFIYNFRRGSQASVRYGNFNESDAQSVPANVHMVIGMWCLLNFPPTNADE